MSLRDILIEARSLIEKGWTQHHCARDEYGVVVASDSERAVCWCILGANNRAGGLLADRADGQLRKVLPPDAPNLSAWNDHPSRTQAEILELYDKAIADA